MKLSVRIFLFFFVICSGIAFPAYPQESSETIALQEKIKQLMQKKNYQADTAYANAINDLGYLYSSTYPDTALLILQGNAERCRAAGYQKGQVNALLFTGDAFQVKGTYSKATENYENAYRVAKKIQYDKALPLILNRIGIIYLNQGNYPEALKKFYESLKAADIISNEKLRGATLNNIAIVYFYQGNFVEAEKIYRQKLAIAQKTNDSSSISLAYNSIGEVKLKQKQPDEARQNFAIAYDIASRIHDQPMLLTIALSKAEAFYELDSLTQAVTLFEQSLLFAKQMDNGAYIGNALIGLARTRYKQGLLKEALANGTAAFEKAQQTGQSQLARDASEIVSGTYEALHEESNALKYFKIYKVYSDSLMNLASERAAANEKAGYELSKKEALFTTETNRQHWILFSVLAALILLTVIAWLVNRNRKRLNQSNKELQKKNELIEIQKTKAEETLTRLQATQAQLIQSEKMASLGELTAGIAHEIQNPLNFVNNFSEVSGELIDELLAEKSKQRSERDEEMENDIIRDLRQNLNKINHHGKRADGIVKGMLLHSRKTKGQKEATDLNALCDEYLRLSYHGLRTKYKSFSANITTDFDDSLGKIDIVSQDVGRVLLNLFNNAFYAVNEKKKSCELTAMSYEPSVNVQTRKVSNAVQIRIEDNGRGISKAIIDKIFQPFFTTKPTGEGTGLGLSLAYDIITKEHGGSIHVESEENLYSKFMITLPA